MVMEEPPRYEQSDPISYFSSDDDNTLSIFDQFPGHSSGYRFRDESFHLSFLDHLPSPAPNHDHGTLNSFHVDSPDDFTDGVSKLLDQILEENMESNQNMFHDPFALHATEKSFYEALGQTYPPGQPPSLIPEETTYRSSSEYSTHSSASGSNTTDPRWFGSDSFDTKSSVTQTRFTSDVNDTMDSMKNTHMVQNIFTDSESRLHFKKGMEEASKFLPLIKPLIIDLGKYNLPSDSTHAPPEVVVKVENVEIETSPNVFRARKHYHLEDNDYENERSSKQSAVYEEEANQLSEMFNKMFLCTNTKGEPMPNCGELPKFPHMYNGWNAHSWIPTTESVDVRTLLLNCAESVAADNYKIAKEQLKQIRPHASPSGNASQRLAHIFVLGLDARLSGTGSQSQKAMRISAGKKLKALQTYMSACPFKTNELYFANRMIYEAASTSSTLHIVDFGIGYGLQWPILIKHLAGRPGGPPKLRITGIELPQPGFRPAERVKETGNRLAGYCDQFNVVFEYNSIATQNWEMIRIEDLKLRRNEFLAVNVLGQFENLVEDHRDGVLKVIRDMKPDIFVQSVVNGSYSAAFFVTRFKEALFHFSGLFDMLDATLDGENEQRQDFERYFYGREAMNVIACEGSERVERPEKYTQWQLRNLRGGFKPRRVGREVVSLLKCKLKMGYHKDFWLDEDGKWMLQGWKGRTLNAISCWVPA